MRIPENVSYIIHTLQDNGEEAYAVGGCVRDTLLDRVPEDWDITTSAKPEKVKALFRRTIDTGLQHGTVTVMLGDEGYEVTTYRVDGEYTDHRHPNEVVYTPNLDEDLMRRDFTINAMAYNEKAGIVDRFDGKTDLKRGIIRAVGVAKQRFTEDALRMLRAVRFAGQLGFQIEADTRTAMGELAPTIAHVSAERIQVEMRKLITSKDPFQLITAYEAGLTDVFFPEFRPMMETTQNNPHHCYSVGMHSLHALKAVNELSVQLPAKQRSILAFAALLHDVGKPSVKSTDDEGIDHFYGHEKNGSEMARKILRRWKLDNETTNAVARMICYHDCRYEGGERGMRRAMNRIGVDIMPLLFLLQEADLRAQSEYKRKEKLDKLCDAVALEKRIEQSKQAVTIKQLAIDGRDLIELGIPKGPRIGEVLQLCLELVLSCPEDNQRDKLLQYVIKTAKEDTKCH